MFNDQGIVFISHAIFYKRFLPFFATFLLLQVDVKVREDVKRKEEKENISQTIFVFSAFGAEH